MYTFGCIVYIQKVVYPKVVSPKINIIINQKREIPRAPNLVTQFCYRPFKSCI